MAAAAEDFITPQELDALSDLDAEQATLSILLDPLARNDYWRDKCLEIRRNVTADDFFRATHQRIFRAWLDLAETEGIEPEFQALAAKLASEDRPYAASLVTYMPSCANAGWYAARVRDRAIKRRALAALGDAAKALYDAETPAQRALETAHLLLDQATVGVSRDAGIFEMPELAESVFDLYENGHSQGARPGWHNLDDLYRVAPGEWTLVTGIPSHGKSAFVDALMVNLAKREQWSFAVCSPENQPLARHVAKLARLWTGKPFYPSNSQPRMTVEELIEAESQLDGRFTFVLPHDRDRSVRGVLGCMEAVIQRRPLHGIVIDPWNELDHSRPHGQTETEFISESLTRIRQFARRYQVHVWLVAHPSKLQRPSEGQPYPVPRPYDVSGSAHWFNKADNALAVYRDERDAWVQVHVQKIRFEQNGQRGIAELRYVPATGEYMDLFRDRP